MQLHCNTLPKVAHDSLNTATPLSVHARGAARGLEPRLARVRVARHGRGQRADGRAVLALALRRDPARRAHLAGNARLHTIRRMPNTITYVKFQPLLHQFYRMSNPFAVLSSAHAVRLRQPAPRRRAGSCTAAPAPPRSPRRTRSPRAPSRGPLRARAEL